MHSLFPEAVLPLFDRIGAATKPRQGVRMTPIEALQLSLRLDLVRLFNTRNGLTIAQFLGGGPTSLDYGLPDTLALSPQSATDLQCWERVITRAILLYEPRLRQVQVTVTQDAARPAMARVVIAATATAAGQASRFDFDASLADLIPAPLTTSHPHA